MKIFFFFVRCRKPWGLRGSISFSGSIHAVHATGRCHRSGRLIVLTSSASVASALRRKLSRSAARPLPTNAVALAGTPQSAAPTSTSRKKPQPFPGCGLRCFQRINTCRPCRRQVPQEREARACRLPETRWSEPWQKQRLRSPERSG